MRIEADFTKISSSFQPLEDGEYQCVVTEIEEKESKEAKLPMLALTLSVNDPNHPDKENHPLYDYIVLMTKKGQPNRVGLGQVKAYAEAILGVDAANNPEGIDVDELKNGMVLAVVKQRSYTKKGENETADETSITNEIVKILPVS